MATVSSTGALPPFRFVTCVEASSDFLRRGKTRMALLSTPIPLLSTLKPAMLSTSWMWHAGSIVAEVILGLGKHSGSSVLVCFRLFLVVLNQVHNIVVTRLVRRFEISIFYPQRHMHLSHLQHAAALICPFQALLCEEIRNYHPSYCTQRHQKFIKREFSVPLICSEILRRVCRVKMSAFELNNDTRLITMSCSRGFIHQFNIPLPSAMSDYFEKIFDVQDSGPRTK